MIKSFEQATIVYMPLETAYNVNPIGGGESQKKDTATSLFEPDRSITPLLLKPEFYLKDPDGILTAGDHTASLINHRWYKNTISESTRIAVSDSEYILGSNGQLTVKANVEPNVVVKLIHICNYVDPRRSDPFVFQKEFTLHTDVTCELNLNLYADFSAKIELSPFKDIANKSLSVQLKNGPADVEDNKAVYLWKVLDGNSFRDIVSGDLFYVSGQGTKTLVVKRSYIDKICVQCEAYHISDPSRKVTVQTLLVRWYGQYLEEQHLVRGKYIRTGTKDVVIQNYVSNTKGIISNPSKYFFMTSYMKKGLPGEQWKAIGYGSQVTIPAEMADARYGIPTIFGLEVRERTAYRPLTVGGEPITFGGSPLCAQFPK